MDIGMKAIRARASVRTYSGEALTTNEQEALRKAFVEAVPGPFGASPRFLIATRDELEDDAAHATPVKGGLRIGTYGMIVGPRSFIVGVIAKRPFACVDFGYCLEGVVLRATELGLGTCWIGGAFGRSAVARALNASKDEFVPATTPIGQAAARPTLQDRLVRGSARAGTRRDPSELFFEVEDDGKLATLRGAGEWGKSLRL